MNSVLFSSMQVFNDFQSILYQDNLRHFIQIRKLRDKKMNNSVSTMSGKTKIKIVLLGNQSVGKSSIIEKYVKDCFDETSNPTVGIDFLVKNVNYKGKAFRLQLWDTAGQQRFRSLIPNYLKDAKCALIVVDVTNPASLVSAQSWLHLYNENKTGEGFAFLVGNKIDLDYREITQQQGKKKADQLGVPYYQLSAKTGQNIQTLFSKLIEISQQGPSTRTITFEIGDNSTKQKKQPSQIKQSAQQQQEDGKQKKKQSQSQGVKQPVHQNTTIVLKNQKLANPADANKKKNNGCC